MKYRFLFAYLLICSMHDCALYGAKGNPNGATQPPVRQNQVSPINSTPTFNHETGVNKEDLAIEQEYKDITEAVESTDHTVEITRKKCAIFKCCTLL